MYIMITSRCNMNCGHCCNYDPNPMDMTFSMFKKVLWRWGHELQGKWKRICLGGGEPTIHPDFWKIISYTSIYGLPWLATNGKRTEDALLLAKLAKQGKVSVCLSLDEWHDPIDPEVVDAFMKGLVRKKNLTGYVSPTPGDRRTIQTITDRTLYKAGKSERGVTSCHCKHMRIFPTGIITGCACDGAPVVGSVDRGIDEPYKHLPIQSTCSRSWVFDGTYYRKLAEECTSK